MSFAVCLAVAALTFCGGLSAAGQERRTPDLCVLNADGTGFRVITDDEAVESRPSWSPDDKKLIYSSAGKYHSRIHRDIRKGNEGTYCYE